MTRPRCMPLRPTRLPDCPMNVALARRAGNQESSNPECCTSRTMFNFQSCGWRGWYRMLLNGIRTSTSRSEEHTSELQSHHDLVCRLLLEKKKKSITISLTTSTNSHT